MRNGIIIHSSLPSNPVIDEQHIADMMGEILAEIDEFYRDPANVKAFEAWRERERNEKQKKIRR